MAGDRQRTDGRTDADRMMISSDDDVSTDDGDDRLVAGEIGPVGHQMALLLSFLRDRPAWHARIFSPPDLHF